MSPITLSHLPSSRQQRRHVAVVLKSFQRKLLEQIISGFESNDKVLLYALCGVGKTIIALAFIEKMIKQGKRVAVSCYSMTEIRNQWKNKIQRFFPSLEEHLQVVVSAQDAKLYGDDPYVVTNGDVSREKKLTIFIPQTITADLGIFDYIAIDEAHEYLEVLQTSGGGKEGKLKAHIRRFSSPQTKYLGITGTGYEIMRPGRFFSDACHVIYDLFQGLEDGAINNCELIGEYFDFDLPKILYNSKKDLNKKGCSKWKDTFGSLNKKGRALLKHEAFVTAKIEEIVKSVSGKTLVVVPHGTGCEEVIANFINVLKGNHRAAVVKTSKLDRALCDRNETMFRAAGSSTDFMVVIDMCSTGWDFEGLNNVIDLTFTRNPKVIIQRFARSVRVVDGKPVSKYYYCIDRSRQKNQAIFDLGRALTLTTRRGIIEESMETVSSYFFRKKAIYGKDGRVTSIEPISFQDILYCEKLSKERFYRKTLKEVLSSDAESVRYRIFGDIIKTMMVTDHERARKFLVELKNISNKEALKKVDTSIFKKVYGTKTPAEVLQEALC